MSSTPSQGRLLCSGSSLFLKARGVRSIARHRIRHTREGRDLGAGRRPFLPPPAATPPGHDCRLPPQYERQAVTARLCAQRARGGGGGGRDSGGAPRRRARARERPAESTGPFTSHRSNSTDWFYMDWTTSSCTYASIGFGQVRPDFLINPTADSPMQRAPTFIGRLRERQFQWLRQPATSGGGGSSASSGEPPGVPSLRILCRCRRQARRRAYAAPAAARRRIISAPRLSRGEGRVGRGDMPARLPRSPATPWTRGPTRRSRAERFVCTAAAAAAAAVTHPKNMHESIGEEREALRFCRRIILRRTTPAAVRVEPGPAPTMREQNSCSPAARARSPSSRTLSQRKLSTPTRAAQRAVGPSAASAVSSRWSTPACSWSIIRPSLLACVLMIRACACRRHGHHLRAHVLDGLLVDLLLLLGQRPQNAHFVVARVRQRAAVPTQFQRLVLLDLQRQPVLERLKLVGGGCRQRPRC